MFVEKNMFQPLFHHYHMALYQYLMGSIIIAQDNQKFKMRVATNSSQSMILKVISSHNPLKFHRRLWRNTIGLHHQSQRSKLSKRPRQNGMPRGKLLQSGCCQRPADAL